MPLFMMVSGFLFAMRRYPMDRPEDYKKFVVDKFKRLMIPYFCISGILIGVKFVAGRFFSLQNPIDNDVWRHLFLEPLGGFASFLWFIYALFIIFLIFPLACRVIRSDLALLVVAILVSMVPVTRLFGLDLAIRHLPFFCLGYVLWRKFPHILNGRGATALAIVGSIVLGYGISLAAQPLEPGTPSYRACILGIGLCGAVVCFLISVWVAGFNGLIRKVFLVAGIYSSGIYLMHTSAMGATRVFLFQVLHLDKTWFEASIFFVCAVGLMAPLVVQKYILQRHRILSRLILGK